MNLHTIYIVHYIPSCDEDYIVYISFFRKNCKLFIKEQKYYRSYELEIKKYTLEQCYRF